MEPTKYLELSNNCDENAPLLSDTPLGQYLDRLLLDDVRPSDLAQLNQSLNVEQLISTRNGLARDYRGLAELMGYNSTELEARFKRSYNPTKCLLDAFKAQRNQNRSAPASVRDLLKLIEKLERFDLIDDLMPTLIGIANESQDRRQNRDNQKALYSENHHRQLVQNFAEPSESDLQQQQLHKYDAFLCYAPEDLDYAQDVMRLLEDNNKRVVTVDNLLAGQFEYDALVQMIAVECRKVIIILTPNFLESRDCEFQAKFANEIAIKSGWFPKIIPILCEPLDDAKLPPLIRVISKIDMTRANQRDWQLRKLLGSLDHGALSERLGSNRAPVMRSRLPSIRQATEVHRHEATSSPSEYSHVNSNSRVQESRQSGSNAASNQHLTARPFVDLAYSQSSQSNISCNLSCALSESSHTASPNSNVDSTLGSSPTSPNGLSAPQFFMNCYRSFKRRVRGASSSSISPSTSSRNILLQSNSHNLDSASELAETDEYNQR